TNLGVSDLALDLGDFYAWHTADGNVVLIMTMGHDQMPTAGQTGLYDPDALYGFHIDTDDDQLADHDIWIRFGQNGAGDWGVQARGVPGATEDLVGSVELDISAGNGVRLFAGLRDDPFFTDVEGFFATASSGDLMFDSTRDNRAGTNCTAIVLQFPVAALGGANRFDTWVTSSRIGAGS
ncbi:MAG: DUF4331 family protein, partial [Myxococcota bacterium]